MSGCLGVMSTLSWAQTQTATLTGTIADVSPSFLPGATIMVSNSQLATSTDLYGEFQLANVPLGNVKLIVRYIGYKDFEQEVEVKTGLNAVGLFILSEVEATLSEVVVSGTMAPSQMKAMTMRKNAVGIVDIMAADAIGKLPDRNAAEAVQRMQGVAVARYRGEADQATVRGTPFAWNSTLLNGNRIPSANYVGNRSAVLDAIPSELIQYVQIAKAITPDMEGDAIGGSINFITRMPPEDRMLSISAAGGGNTFSKNGTYNTSLVYGDRFFKKKLGVILSGAVWERNWGTDLYEVAYNTELPDPKQQVSLKSLLLKRYMGKRRTSGLNAGLEYKFNANHKVFSRGLLDRFDDVRPVYESYFLFNENQYQYQYRFSQYKTDIRGLEVGGEHQLSNKFRVNWSVSEYLSQYIIDTPPNNPNEKQGIPVATFKQRVTSKFGGRSSDGYRYLLMDSPDGIGDDPMDIQARPVNPAEVMDPTKLTLQQLVIAQGDTKEKDKVASMDLRFNASQRLNLKAGGKYRYKTREAYHLTGFGYLPGVALGLPGKPLIPLSKLQETEAPDEVPFMKDLGRPYDNTVMNPLSKNTLYNLFNPDTLTANGFYEFIPPTYQSTIYHGSEEVGAGYVMGEFDVTPKLKLTGGFRSEYTKVRVNSTQVTSSKSNNKTVYSYSPVSVTNEYNMVLPMAHLKYSPTDKANIRAAYTRTFVRPNFSDLTPGGAVDLTRTQPTMTKGNTELMPTSADNYDLLGEYFFKDIGLVSGGVFYKDLTNVIFQDRSITNIEGTNYLVTQPKNLQNGHLYGLELAINKRFSFLPGVMSGFGVELNYTNIKSEVKVTRTVGQEIFTDKTSLPNQSKHLFNAILFYERNGIMARLAGNFRGKSVETISQQLGPQLYTWADDIFTLDFSGAYAITKKLRVFVELNNLTNKPVKYYLGEEKRVTQVEWYGIRGQAGLRYQLF